MLFSELFPGFDYIGSSSYDGVQVALPNNARGARIFLGAAVPEILHLQLVQLVDSQGRAVCLEDPSISVHVSSVYNDDDCRHGAGAVRAGKGFHTKREFHPFLEISWSACSVARLQIHNRPDEFGRRSASLAVAARVDNSWQELYRHDSVNRVASLLANASAYTAPSQMAVGLIGNAGADLRRRVVEALLDRIRAVPSVVHDVAWVLPLLDIYGGGDQTDVQLLSAYFAGTLLRGQRVSQLSAARKILCTPDRLLASEEYVNRYLAAAGLEGQVLYTRHGLQRSQLRSRAGAYLDLAEEVISVLAANGIESFLSYGTLLGAVRDRAFIAHDDDVDVVYVGQSRCLTDLSERQRVLECLANAGFTLSPQLPLLNVHVSKGDPGISIDVFPSWRGDGVLYMYMEKMVIREVVEKNILPLGIADFYGRAFPVPADPSGFLGDRYGANWSVSDRFFEWPYPLVR